MGDYLVGIRVSNDALGAAVRALLADYVHDGVTAPPNLSLLVEPPADGGVIKLHQLFQGHRPVLRTRSAVRAAWALVHHLAVYAQPDADDLVQVDALTVVRDGLAVLAPSRWRAKLLDRARQLERAGFAIVDHPVVRVDPATRRLLLPDPGLHLRAEGFAALRALAPEPTRDEPRVPPAEYALAGWLFPGGDYEPVRPSSAVLRVAAQVRNLAGRGAAQALEELATVMTRLYVAQLPADSSHLINALVTAAGEAENP